MFCFSPKSILTSEIRLSKLASLGFASIQSWIRNKKSLVRYKIFHILQILQKDITQEQEEILQKEVDTVLELKKLQEAWELWNTPKSTSFVDSVFNLKL